MIIPRRNSGTEFGLSPSKWRALSETKAPSAHYFGFRKGTSELENLRETLRISSIAMPMTRMGTGKKLLRLPFSLDRIGSLGAIVAAIAAPCCFPLFAALGAAA